MTLPHEVSVVRQLAEFFKHLPRGISMKEARRLDPIACRRAGVFMDANKDALVAEISGKVRGTR